jgi:hypothetical protein
MTESPPESPPRKRGLKKGCKRNPNSGRKKGTPNKINADLRAMILGALSDAGGQKYLTAQAKKNPQAFLGLVGRCLPKDIHLSTTSLEDLLTQAEKIEKGEAPTVN